MDTYLHDSRQWRRSLQANTSETPSHHQEALKRAEELLNRLENRVKERTGDEKKSNRLDSLQNTQKAKQQQKLNS